MAKELELKYGCNPNQKPSRIFMQQGELPIEVLNGRPGYINFLDAFNSWQLVKELKEATGLPAAASFKHVSPAGAAVGIEMNDTLKKIYFVDDLPLTPLATAYARARGADRMSSYGDFIALSDICDEATARLINREVSDGVIAPDYTLEALEILKNKRKGTYNIIKIDPDYCPAPIEHKDVFGITFEQGRNEIKLDENLLTNIPTLNKNFPDEAKRDLIIALITLKYTQSNSVCYVKDGQAIGIGAGQQSRIHCTRLAGNKADIWYLRQHPKVMNLPWIEKIRRADRDNTIDVYISDDHEDVLADGIWQRFFTEKPEILTREAKRDLIIALITLKYTQSNSVCYVKDGQAIGIGAGQQSRIHCTRLAGNKADIWYLRQHPKVMNLPWIEKIRRADRDNTIDVYISDDHEDVLADGIWQRFFTEKPEILTREEKRAWLDTLKGVSLGSDAFFPFGDNIERAHKSGVDYIAQAGGSVRDDHVIDTCDKYGIAMAFTGVRLFHH